jgi:hypothetical protein
VSLFPVSSLSRPRHRREGAWGIRVPPRPRTPAVVVGDSFLGAGRVLNDSNEGQRRFYSICAGRCLSPPTDGINGGGAELGVSEPLLYQAESKPGGDGGTPKPCRRPRAWPAHARARRPASRHAPPAPGHPRPRPESYAAAFAVPGAQFPDAMHHVDGIEQGRGFGHAAKASTESRRRMRS